MKSELTKLTESIEAHRVKHAALVRECEAIEARRPFRWSLVCLVAAALVYFVCC